MTLLPPTTDPRGVLADPANEVRDWETLLLERDRGRLEALRQAGADVVWSCKSLDRDDGGRVVHHLVEVRSTLAGHKTVRARLGMAGPTDFRYGNREQLVQKMTRSVLGQALAALHLELP
jgi:hypothetical protein